MKNQFASVFPSSQASTDEVLAGIKAALNKSDNLSVYANRV
ncbi:MAG: hypothetical protein R3A13_05925 [Bdellovibrionota bacterium]